MEIARLSLGRSVVLALCAMAFALACLPSVSQAAFDDPLFLMRPTPPEPPPNAPPPPRIPPPAGELEGPCGVAVDATGRVYVSDYYHDAVDLFGADINPNYSKGANDPTPPYGYLSQSTGIDTLDGPCGLALDALGNLYLNDFHRAVIGPGGTVIDGAPTNEARPTGVAIDPVTQRLYVNERTRIAVYDLLSGTRLGQIGEGTLGDGYGLAVSRYPGTVGDLYVPDAQDNTLKVYEPTLGSEDPIETIDGSGTPTGHFTSLRDAAVAIDNTTGEVYVTDNLQPVDTSRPEAVVRVFDATGAYEGRLKYSVVFGLPLGLAVDNSPTPSQGRVYVTTSNTSPGGIYAYPPHAATSAAVALPEPFELGGVKGAGLAAPAASAGAPAAQLLAPELLGGATGAGSSAPSSSHRHHHNKRHRPRHHRPSGRAHR